MKFLQRPGRAHKMYEMHEGKTIERRLVLGDWRMYIFFLKAFKRNFKTLDCPKETYWLVKLLRHKSKKK